MRSSMRKSGAEMDNPGYAPVPSAALALYDRDQLVLADRVRVIWIHDVERPSDNFWGSRWRRWSMNSGSGPVTTFGFYAR